MTFTEFALAVTAAGWQNKIVVTDQGNYRYFRYENEKGHVGLMIKYIPTDAILSLTLYGE